MWASFKPNREHIKGDSYAYNSNTIKKTLQSHQKHYYAYKLQENNTYKFILQNFLTFHKKYANIGNIKVLKNS
jgi:hypothetical protein